MRRYFPVSIILGFLISVTVLLPVFQAFLLDTAFAAKIGNSNSSSASVAYAQTSNISTPSVTDPEVEEDGVSQAEVQDTYNSDLSATVANLDLLNNSGTLSISPQDMAAIKDDQVDTRVTDYLINLVTPVSSGGMGLTHVKASSILKGHTSGSGQTDNETLAISEGNSLTSAHTDGKAVDISEVGQVTCEVRTHTTTAGVSSSHHTAIQPPTPVKVSWQTSNGANGQGTPNSNSVLGVSSQVTANGVKQYLNSTGNLDSTIDYVQGTDMSTIGLYVGANALLKALGVNQVQSNPLESSFIQVLGEAILKDNASSIPTDIAKSNPNDDYRLAIGRTDLENKLGLPAGSLAGFGWENILTNSGKRLLEQSLGLTPYYFDTHTLAQANASGQQLSTALNSMKSISRSDDTLNAMIGAISKISTNDPVGFEMIAAHQIEDAFNLSNSQKTLLENAITGKNLSSLNVVDATTSEPVLDPTTFAIDNALPVDGVDGLFSANPSDQQIANTELQNQGSAILAKATPKATGGLTQTVINDMTSQGAPMTIKDFLTQIGAGQLLSQAGLNLSDLNNFIANPNGSSATAVANLLNTTIGISGSPIALTNTDIAGMFNPVGTAAEIKAGGTELDKGFSLYPGTGDQIVSGQKQLKDVTPEILSNIVSSIIGTQPGSVSTIGNLGDNATSALINQTFGLSNGNVSSIGGIQDLINKMGVAAFQKLFGISPTQLTPSVFSDPGISDQVTAVGANMGVSAPIIESFLLGQLNMSGLATQVKNGIGLDITPDKILNYFDISDNNKPSSNDMANILSLFTTNATLQPGQNNNINAALNNLISAPVDTAAGFDTTNGSLNFKGTLLSGTLNVGNILKLGVNQLIDNMGEGLSSVTSGQLKTYVDSFISSYFNGSPGGNGSITVDTGASTQTAQEELQLEADYGISPSGTAPPSTAGSTAKSEPQLNSILRSLLDQAKAVMSPDDLKTYTTLINNNNVQGYLKNNAQLYNFLSQATGIPSQYVADATSLLKGDFTYGFAAMSFALWQKDVNPYLPVGSQLDYGTMRNAISFNNASAINSKIVASGSGGNLDISKLITSKYQSLYNTVRSQFMNLTKKDTQYAITDGLLRKDDPTIPVGFTKTMLSGTDTERTLMLQTFAVSSLDQAIKKAYPGYVPGTLQALINGQTASFNKDALQGILTQYHITLGPINNTDVVSFYNFLTASPAGQKAALSLPQFGSMWGSVNTWMSQTLGIALPGQSAQAIYNASQNGWNLNQGIKGAQGQVSVPSINQLGTDFLTSKLTAWADKELKLPANTVFQIVKAVNSVSDASKALAAAKAGVNGVSSISAYTNAKNSLSQAQKNLGLLVINIALQLCSSCQQFFGSVDKSLGFLPGTTNAIAAGLIAMAFHLGPAGLYIAAALIVISFATHTTVKYLCPMPPSDPYSQPAYDAAYNDSFSFGRPYNPGSGPAPQASPNYSLVGTSVALPNGQVHVLTTDDVRTTWENSVTFVDGNDPKLWEAWSRYYTGLLLSDTLAYGANQDDTNKPRQVITYRRANVEYFAAQSGLMSAAFGTIENGNSFVGMGYSQGSTNTYAWVHIGFGGV